MSIYPNTKFCIFPYKTLLLFTVAIILKCIKLIDCIFIKRKLNENLKYGISD